MKSTSFKLMLTALIAFAIASTSFFVNAQPSGSVQSISPLTRTLPTLQTFTSQTAGTANSADQSGYNVSRVVCVFNMLSHSGSPSTTIKIQNKDAASGNYYTLITSATVTADTTPTPVAAGAGLMSTAGAPVVAMPIATAWRTQVVVGGTSTPVVAGTVGCSVQ